MQIRENDRGINNLRTAFPGGWVFFTLTEGEWSEREHHTTEEYARSREKKEMDLLEKDYLTSIHREVQAKVRIQDLEEAINWREKKGSL